jgi:hypothetical protein
MISFDLECGNGHKFEGIFNDYESYNEQFNKKMIACPVCESLEIKRLYTGCSIQSKPSDNIQLNKDNPNIFDLIKVVHEYVKKNFENVGNDFADKARAMYYGIEEQKNIYGISTAQEVKDLIEEGISVIPIPQVDKLEN